MAIFMFADVIHIITVHAQDGEYCATNAAPEEFCEPGVGRVYLKLYAVLVGDVNLEDFEYRCVFVRLLYLVLTALCNSVC